MAAIKLTGDTSGEITIAAPAVAGTNTLTLPASTGTLTTTDVATNAPIFYGQMSANQSIVDITETTVAFDIASIDTDSAFNTSTNTYTIPTGKGGKYAVSSFLRVDSGSASNMSVGMLNINVNGAIVRRAYDFFSNSYIRASSLAVHAIIDLSAGDTLHISSYVNTVSGANATVNSGAYSGFSLHRLIG